MVFDVTRSAIPLELFKLIMDKSNFQQAEMHNRIFCKKD
jgi:hypothetical protein